MNELVKSEPNMVVAKGGKQEEFSLDIHGDFRTFRRVWNTVTKVPLAKEMTVYLGNTAENSLILAKQEEVSLDRSEIKLAFSKFVSEENIRFSVDPWDANTRLFPIDKTVAFIKEFISDLRESRGAI